MVTRTMAVDVHVGHVGHEVGVVRSDNDRRIAANVAQYHQAVAIGLATPTRLIFGTANLDRRALYRGAIGNAAYPHDQSLRSHASDDGEIGQLKDARCADPTVAFAPHVHLKHTAWLRADQRSEVDALLPRRKATARRFDRLFAWRFPEIVYVGPIPAQGERYCWGRFW